MKFRKEDNPDYSIHFSDVNSLYTHIGLSNQFPVGKYSIYLDKDNFQQHLTFENGEYLFKKESTCGDAAHVTILPPIDLKRPYLGYRVDDVFNFLSLCKQCAKEKRHYTCGHEKNDVRAFTSCYMLTDLAKCVALGYEITNWYELHHYEKRDYILKPFLRVLASAKLKNSGILNDIPANEHINLCDMINAKMEFTENQILQPEDIQDNPAQKQLYKDISNSFFGRFGMHTNFSTHHFCRLELAKLNILSTILMMLLFRDFCLKYVLRVINKNFF